MIRGRFVVIISMGQTAEQRPFPPTYTPTSALVRCQNSSVPLTRAVNLIKRTVKKTKLECGPMPNVMVALPNIGGALCSTPQSLADDHY